MCNLPLLPPKRSPRRSCSSPLRLLLLPSWQTMPNRQQPSLLTPGLTPEVRIGTITAICCCAGTPRVAQLCSAKVAACMGIRLLIAEDACIQAGTPPATIATATQAWAPCRMKRLWDSQPIFARRNPHQCNSNLRQLNQRLLRHHSSSSVQVAVFQPLTG